MFYFDAYELAAFAAGFLILGWVLCWYSGVLRELARPRGRRVELPSARGTLKDGKLHISLERFRANERDRVLRLPHHRGRR